MNSTTKNLFISMFCFLMIIFTVFSFIFLKEVSPAPGGSEENVKVALTVTISGAGGSTITILPRTTDEIKTAEAKVGTEIDPNAAGSNDEDEALDGIDPHIDDWIAFDWSNDNWGVHEENPPAFNLASTDAGNIVTVSVEVSDEHPPLPPRETKSGTVDDTNHPMVTVNILVPKIDINACKNESEEENPGIYINVNWSDNDNDGWDPVDKKPPDATYTPDKNDTEITGGDPDLWSVALSLSPTGLSGKVRITYNSQGRIKVWSTRTKKIGSNSSEIASGTEFNVGEFPATMYVEGISGSSGFKDVELKAEYIKEGQVLSTDIIKYTVFEVTLEGIYLGSQPDGTECDKRFSTFQGSSDNNGKISFDDANGDGTTGDIDTNCR